MLKDSRTWTTLAYLILMLPLGIAYFVIAVVGLAAGLSFLVAPLITLLHKLGLVGGMINAPWVAAAPALVFMKIIGLINLTSLMYTARGIGRIHARLAKRFLVTQG
jgi:hypothetical protein